MTSAAAAATDQGSFFRFEFLLIFYLSVSAFDNLSICFFAFDVCNFVFLIFCPFNILSSIYCSFDILPFDKLHSIFCSPISYVGIRHFALRYFAIRYFALRYFAIRCIAISMFCVFNILSVALLPRPLARRGLHL